MISWPEKYDPKNRPVWVSNEMDIPAPIETVWAWLIRATLWPTWYPNSANVVIDGGAKDLSLGARFHWRTFRVNLESEVTEFVPPERIAWHAKAGAGLDAYHAFLLVRTAAGTHVLTEETQDGFVAKLNNRLRPKDMHSGHELWLEKLAEKAKSGPP